MKSSSSQGLGSTGGGVGVGIGGVGVVSSSSIPSSSSSGVHGGVASGVGGGGGIGVGSNAATIQAAGNSLWTKQPKVNAELFALTYGALVSEVVRDMDQQPDKIQDELDRMGHSIGIRCIEEVLAKVGGTIGLGVISMGGGGGGNSSSSSTKQFPQTADLMKVAFRMFLGINVEAILLSTITPSSSTTTTTTTSSISNNSSGDPSSSSTTAANNNNITANNAASSSSSSNVISSYKLRFIENPLTIFVELPDEYKNSNLEYSQLLVGMIRGMLEMLQYDCICTMTSSILKGDDINEITVTLKQVIHDGAGDEYQEE